MPDLLIVKLVATPLLVAGVVASVALVLRLLPATRIGRSATPHPGWDLPARIVVGRRSSWDRPPRP